MRPDFKPDFVNITIDWEGLEKASSERWEDQVDGPTHCRVHDTYFFPRAEEGGIEEPCWQCYNEFSKEN